MRSLVDSSDRFAIANSNMLCLSWHVLSWCAGASFLAERASEEERGRIAQPPKNMVRR
jgi:hypothetical protein